MAYKRKPVELRHYNVDGAPVQPVIMGHGVDRFGSQTGSTSFEQQKRACIQQPVRDTFRLIAAERRQRTEGK